jgi:pimeloyl-ACP methyl ester carboxylesterase
VIPALRLKPAADPLFILSGGPGQAASDFYLSVAPAFSRIRRDRDLVLVDQRGTGRSNRLDCTLPDASDFSATDPQKAAGPGARMSRVAARRPALLHDEYRRARPGRVRAALGYER